ncbi:DUF535 family protein [Dyella sp. GSA-30]|uniref:DUF535 family protein n=1 Tax=Dyella sp. GSA-30 TaxID=2994496 RepID=UPI0024920A2F|nr:DUF535 family protein [Dyella sp. GSA-30]BDU23102.1 hypothetical protein DYGSA30_45590 [Dyella sp. GSA-30]
MIGEAKATYALWLRAWRAGRTGSPLHSEVRLYRWLRHFPQQVRWLEYLQGSEALRRAAEADPKLYDRWHRPYISRHFGAHERLRIIDAHYDFLSSRFPKRMRERIIKGHDIRVAMLRLENAVPAYLHLRKPVDGNAGELGIYLLNEYKEALASCVVTFAGAQGLLIGSIQGAWSYMAEESTREFVRGSCGLHPKDLLLSLIRALAHCHGIEEIRAVARTARISRGPVSSDDSFLQAHGGLLTEAGCYDMPLDEPLYPQATSQRRRLLEQRREAFRREACALLVRAFDGYPHGAVEQTRTATIEATHRPAAFGTMARA